MNKDKIYQLLEDKMLKYKDLVQIPAVDNEELIINLSKENWIITKQIDDRMTNYTGEDIYVRESVMKRLKTANRLLQEIIPKAKLEVVYGYRSIEIQERLFQQFRKELSSIFKTEEELLESVHRLIAAPTVSGHPTGGAIDLQIIDKYGIPINMGTEIWSFIKDSYTFSPFIENEEWKNRQILRRIMTLVGFAPFDGEWWHFSYGDKEWAKYYNKPMAIYEQMNFKV